ncbi:accessory Sec system protein Asp3 [Lactobacillus sp. ESL0791]|uniref:accessory Sec system protein Asp3 n=1 Tax=Lactobacillus sp. ESL0791 TaxID=2983234 RepID=UPI0023F77FF5|nr:accessory Sec system protein Asp3 [Lactobacillus sp. ESL0791]MDF7639678.1 accessory Sec system protein Asp3 [Lactobacillus sp. ESL0791]
MADDKKLTAHFFFRPQNMSYVYLYGAQVSFAGEDLLYKNAIVSPGKALVSWLYYPVVSGEHISSLSLPKLLFTVDYQFKLESEEEPKGSLALALTTYDDRHQQLGYKIFPAKDGTFHLPRQTASYQFDLVSLNNQKMRFKVCLLAEAPILDHYTFVVENIAGIRIIKVCFAARKSNRLNVHLQNYTSTIQTVSFTAQEDHLFIFIPVQYTGEGKFSTEQLTALARYLNSFRRNGIILQIDNSYIATELLGALRHDIGKNK